MGNKILEKIVLEEEEETRAMHARACEARALHALLPLPPAREIPDFHSFFVHFEAIFETIPFLFST